MTTVPPRSKRCQAVIGRCHVKQRRPCHEGVTLKNVQFGAEYQRARDHGAVRDDGAFGQAGGSAGVENDEAVLRIDHDGRRMSALLPQQMLILFADHDQFATVGAAVTQTRGQILFRDQKLRRHELDAIGEFALRQPPVQAGGDDAEIGRRQFDLQIFRPVARQQRDAIAANQAASRQYGVRRLDAIQQLAIADQAVLIFDRRQGFLNRARGAKQLADVGVAPAISVGDLRG